MTTSGQPQAPGINLSDDDFLSYYVPLEAHYAPVLLGHNALDPTPRVNICSESPGGGVEWEFVVYEINHGARTVLKLQMFDEALPALRQIAPFFNKLIDRKLKTLAEVRALLEELGAVDTTEREAVSR